MIVRGLVEGRRKHSSKRVYGRNPKLLITLALAVALLRGVSVSGHASQLSPSLPALDSTAIEPGNSAPAITLEQAVNTALKHHPSLRQREEQREVSAALVREEEGRYLPHISLEAIEKDGPPSAPSLGLVGLSNSTFVHHDGIDLAASQLLTDFGRTNHEIAAREFSETAAAADKEAERADTVLGVYQAYYDVLLAQELKLLAVEDTATREATVKEAQARFDAGLSSRVDVELARTSLSQAKAHLSKAENDVLQAFAVLNTAMGVERPAAYSLREESIGMAPSLDTLKAQPINAEANRPELRGIEARIRSAEESARAAGAGRLPVIRMLASAGYINVSPTISGERVYAVGIGFTFPFFNGGQTQAEVDAARHHSLELQANRDELKRTLDLQVTQSKLNLTSLMEQQASVQDALVQAQDAAGLAAQRYQAGLGNIIELQNAQLALLTAQTDVSRLRYETAEAAAEFRFATGVLVSALATQER